MLDRVLGLTEEPAADVRLAAADALGALSQSAATPSVLERVLALLVDPNAHVRRAAGNALRTLGPAATNRTDTLVVFWQSQLQTTAFHVIGRRICDIAYEALRQIAAQLVEEEKGSAGYDEPSRTGREA